MPQKQSLPSSLGYALIPELIDTATISSCRDEADRVAQEAGSACVRHLRSRSPLFHTFAVSPRLLDLIPLGMRPVRSILFDKTAEENWPVPWHQDLTIAVAEKKNITGYGPWSVKNAVPHVQPPEKLLREMVTIRIHLDVTSSENGALRVIPKSHLLGRIPSQEVTLHSAAPEVVCECAPGDALLMSPLILHASSKSEEPSRRRILHFEYARADALNPALKWYEGI